MRQKYDDLTFTTTVTAKNMHLYLTRQLSDFNITPEQWSVLNVIQQKQPLTQKELAQLVLKDTPTVNRIIDVLVRKELVSNETDPLDRRKAFINLTSKGEEETTQLRTVVEETCSTLFSHIQASDLQIWQQIMKQINKNIL
ncbi:MarR family winged helix-turn-helix transcriptional regulator [Listeria fleischmannii]|uniref:MarR family transcriptional regulator n=1 Tax=Listeria fleischmannii TaxID=1069827 RepID=A0A841YEK3_9LIST|nr:MarR family transcriptional regulator [Listeria fleischmannii]MBC1398775.1 MarR family transcriptional regulator [Listeria fleischmannii]MBC1418110.1 MarR family transcriptional regulator [Listeria fleischmannii]MBC1426882.1 MarR family transcriptional regulator [Listeria fleischmannii]